MTFTSMTDEQVARVLTRFRERQQDAQCIGTLLRNETLSPEEATAAFKAIGDIQDFWGTGDPLPHASEKAEEKGDILSS